jgi:prolyl 4-hydroxylase
MNLKPSEINNLSPGNFIAGWYIDPALCDSIVERANAKAHLFEREDEPRTYDWINMLKVDEDLNYQYCESLWWALEHYKKMFPWCYQDLRQWGFTVPRFQQYQAGESYTKPHCENDGREGCEYRHFAYMTYLNDIQDGGGTEFIHQNLITTPKKGLTLIWPATWTHYHKGVVAPSETKNIITGWCIFNI